MNWFSGNISEAVKLSKEKNAIFVVYVEGDDELSQKLRGFINDDRIKSKLEGEEFVAIRIEGGSTAYMQFAQIYQLVLLPSLFFIGKNGVPLEVATGIISSVDELETKINNVLKLAGLPHNDKNEVINETKALNIPSSSTPSTSASTISAATTSLIKNEQQSEKNTATNSTPTGIVCDGDICYPQPADNKDAEKSEQSNNKTEMGKTVPVNVSTESETTEAKINYGKKMLEIKRKEREAEEAELEREKEIKRRKEGQQMQNLKNWQKDQELQQLKEKIQKDKQEEQAARQRILEQIAGDRAERAQRMNLNTIPPQPAKGSSPKPSTSQKSSISNSDPNSEYTRIQFRKQTGETETHSFLVTDKFQVVRNFVKEKLIDGSKVREFSLATTFPRREFTSEDDSKTLKELDLYRSVVLLILIPTNMNGPAAVVARSGGLVNIFNTLFWGILSPVFAVFSYIKGLFTGKKQNQDKSGAQKRNNEATPSNDGIKRRNLDRLNGNEIIDDNPSTSQVTFKGKSVPYKRIGKSNIHRLRDHKDTDDENNTWNGNSTQQQ